MSRNIISKGKFDLPLTSNFISPIQFLYIKEDGHNFLLLKLSNDRDEKVTGVTLEITQKDLRGLTLHISTVDCPISNGNPHSKFVIDSKILLENNCTDFTVKVIAARIGNKQFIADGSELVSKSQKNNSRKAINSVALLETNAPKCPDISVRKFKIPVVVCVFMLALLSLSIVFTYLQFQDFVANAQSFFYRNVEYAFKNGDKSEGSDIYVIGSKPSTREIIIPSKVKDYRVVGISENAFYGNVDIVQVTINAPIEIADNAFANCTSLSVINLEKVTEIGNLAFQFCNSLKEFTATSLSVIGESAFEGCGSLKSINISNSQSVLQIGWNAFGNCYGLTNVVIDQYVDYSENLNIFMNSDNVETLYLKNYNHNFEFDDINYIDSNNNTISSLFGYNSVAGDYIRRLKELTIENCDVIPTMFCYNLPLTSVTIKNLGTTEVGSNAFANCVRLNKLDVPIDFTSVGDFAFFNTAITKFDGTKLLYIGDNAFAGCEKLSEFTLEGNESLTNIGESAFNQCISLKSFVIPQTVTVIKNRTFQSCSSLTNLLLNDNLQQIGDYAFAYCEQIKTLVVPESVSKIGVGAFSNCTGLGEITLPFIGGSLSTNNYFAYIFGDQNPQSLGIVPSALEKVTIKNATTIPQYAFYGCSYLKEIIIESDFTSIGTYSFYNCKRLKSFVIPASVTLIDTDAFTACYKLFEIYNLSQLTIFPSSPSNGNAGYNALKVYKSLNEESMPKVSDDGYEFGCDDNGKWYLLNYVGTATSLSLPDKLYYNSNLIESYEVIHHMASGNNTFNKVYISNAVSGIGDYAFENCTSLLFVSVSDSVSFIGLGAFLQCVALEEMILPFIGNTPSDNRYLGYIFGSKDYNNTSDVSVYLHTITITHALDVPDYAFFGFGTLTTVILPEYYERIGESAFSKCYSLENMELSANLVSIGKNAFSGCFSMTSVAIPDSVSSVGLGAFAGCTSLNKITLPFVGESAASNRYFGYIFGAADAYSWSAVPSSLATVILTKGKDIPDYAFYNCESIKEIILPSELESIGKYAFYRCYGLIEIEFPPSLKQIGTYAFTDCQNLQKATLSSEIDIKENAFTGCNSLLEIYNLGEMTLKEGSKDHGYIAFYAVVVYTSLEDATIEEVIIEGIVYKHVGNNWTIVNYYGYSSTLKLSAFVYQGNTISSYNIANGAFDHSGGLVHLVIGKEVTSIGENAFRGCYSLESVTLVDSVITELCDNTFAYCNSLTSVVLPQGLKTIGRDAFTNCTQLYSIKIPENVSEIKSGAFSRCYALSDVYNFSKLLNVMKGNEDNGYVAYYALRVSTSSAIEPLVSVISTISETFRFVLYENQWYMTAVKNVSNENFMLPESFTYNDTVINSYILSEGAIFLWSFNSVYIPNSVFKLYNPADWLHFKDIYYGGTQEEWTALINTLPTTLLKDKIVYFNSSDWTEK